MGFDEKVISLYARGLTVREIQGHLAEIYGTEVSPELISKITDAVLEDAKAWQNRPLERLYPIVYLDALVVKIRDGQAVRNFACYVAIAVNLEGERDVLGIWFQKTEGAKFWMQVLTELKQRGLADVLIFCVDGVTGFPEAIEATFPHSTVQTCLVHQVRLSLKFVSYKDRKHVAADLRQIYTAASQDAAADELERFAEKWDGRYRRSAKAGSSAGSRSSPSWPTPGRPPSDLHDELDRSATPTDPQDHQDTRALPDRGRRPQAALPRDHQSRDPVAASGSLALGDRSIQHPLPRPHSRHRDITGHKSTNLRSSCYTDTVSLHLGFCDLGRRSTLMVTGVV